MCILSQFLKKKKKFTVRKKEKHSPHSFLTTGKGLASPIIPHSVSFHISGIIVPWKDARARAVTGCVYSGCEFHDF